jgi:hypothetical protein
VRHDLLSALPTDLAERLFASARSVRLAAGRASCTCLCGTNRLDGKFSRADFIFDRERNAYVCPASRLLTPAASSTMPYRASAYDCSRCELKPRCTTAPARKVSRAILMGISESRCVLSPTLKGSSGGPQARPELSSSTLDARTLLLKVGSAPRFDNVALSRHHQIKYVQFTPHALAVAASGAAVPRQCDRSAPEARPRCPPDCGARSLAAVHANRGCGTSPPSASDR